MRLSIWYPGAVSKQKQVVLEASLVFHIANFFFARPGTTDPVPRVMDADAVEQAWAMSELSMKQRMIMLPSLTPAMGPLYPPEAAAVRSVLQAVRQQEAAVSRGGSASLEIGLPLHLPASATFPLGQVDVDLLAEEHVVAVEGPMETEEEVGAWCPR